MSPLTICLMVLTGIFASSLLGMWLRSRLPKEHLSPETKDTVKLVVGIVGTMTGMVLGLMVASAKSSFDGQRGAVAQLAANVVLLDRSLSHYGPDADEARQELRRSVEDMRARIWPDQPAAPGEKTSPGLGDARYDDIYDRVLTLQPATDAQRTTHEQALKIMHDTASQRWLLYSQRGSSIPPVFLTLMVAWLALTFASFGLFAPRHATTFAVLFVGSLVVSSAVYLILELDHPFGGLVSISDEPLRNELGLIGK